jgi:putative DNA primase/helicase
VGDATRYQRYLVLFATGGNGKSELLRVFRSMFPSGTTASIEPQKWRDDRHAAALEGVRGNFVDELPDDEIMGSHSVKKIVTGEPVTARRVYRDTITFTPIAGHVLATNAQVQSTDYSDGFWERPLVLVLSRKFRQSSERRLEAAKAIVENELPAIVAWAVEGACRAQTQQGYTEPASSRATLLEWRDDNDQVRGFMADEGRPGRWAATALYEEYREWAKKNGCAVMSAAKFGRRVVANGLARRGRDGHSRWYDVGEAVAGPAP